MDFTLSKIHEQTRELVRAFAQRELAPGAQTRDEEERFDRSLFDKMANLGITGIPYPEKYGGGDLDHLANVKFDFDTRTEQVLHLKDLFCLQ